MKRAAARIGINSTPMIVAEPGKQTIVITGTVSNLDSRSKIPHFVTITVEVAGVVRYILNDAPVPYGGSLEIPKIILEGGDKLSVSASSFDVLDAYISYVEKW